MAKIQKKKNIQICSLTGRWFNHPFLFFFSFLFAFLFSSWIIFDLFFFDLFSFLWFFCPLIEGFKKKKKKDEVWSFFRSEYGSEVESLLS